MIRKFGDTRMNQFKALFAILALGFSLNSMAITDDQSV